MASNPNIQVPRVRSTRKSGLLRRYVFPVQRNAQSLNKVVIIISSTGKVSRATLSSSCFPIPSTPILTNPLVCTTQFSPPPHPRNGNFPHPPPFSPKCNLELPIFPSSSFRPFAITPSTFQTAAAARVKPRPSIASPFRSTAIQPGLPFPACTAEPERASDD